MILEAADLDRAATRDEWRSAYREARKVRDFADQFRDQLDQPRRGLLSLALAIPASAYCAALWMLNGRSIGDSLRGGIQRRGIYPHYIAGPAGRLP